MTPGRTRIDPFSGRMIRTIRALLPIALIVLFGEHLPAPISETPEATPTPKPKREAPAKPRSKPKSEATPKPAATVNRSFAGTWTGTVSFTSSTGESGSTNYIIKISDDEKTVLVNLAEVGKTISGPPWQFTCARFRDALSWGISDSGGMTTYTMRINPDGSSNFLREGRYTGGDYDGVTYTHTGTLLREGASPPSPVSQTITKPAPQTTVTAAPKTAGDLPLAKAVPNKPGFVYNPFDPNSRILLDVRGRASGTKVIEPKSGKLFVIP
jgi:hypothetical protein